MPTAQRLIREVRRFAAAAGPDEHSDRTLLDRFRRSRDEAAFAELVRRHGPMVLGVCRRVLRHAADADDAFQAVFLILVRRAAVIRDADRLGPWLFGVAWRTANKLRNTRRPVAPLPDDLSAKHIPATDWPVELDAAIARLPEKYRTPVVLCHLQGLSAAEAARRLGCPPATVSTRLFRARTALRRRLTTLGLAVPAALVAESVLDVPPALAAAAHSLATGHSVSPAAVRLADGVFRSLLMTKIRWAATAAAVFLAGVGLFGFRVGGHEPAGTTTPPPVKKDVAAAPFLPEGEQPTTVKTANFRVTAPSARVARLVADAAERTRKDAAVAWLGKELPTRPTACRIVVTINPTGNAGATSFDYQADKVPHAEMKVEGALDRLLTDVVPHEVTHVVLAEHFRKPLPRWADEGIAVLSESDDVQANHLRYTAEAAGRGDLMQLKALCSAREYPQEVMAFFAQSHALAKTLVERKDRPALLAFVRVGMEKDWESAAKELYGVPLDEIEREFLEKLKTAKSSGAAATPPAGGVPSFAWATLDASGKVVVYERLVHYYEPVTSYVRRSVKAEGSENPKNYFEPVTTYRMRTVPAAPRTVETASVRATTADGKPLDQAALQGRLKGKTVAVVLAAAEQKIDAAFLGLLKADAIILELPRVKVEQPTTPPETIPGGR